MLFQRRHSGRIIAGALAGLIALTACGAGSKTADKTAANVGCDVEKPAAATTINVLAYNSSAIDPFTNTMIASCTMENLAFQHDPIDFAGQKQKTVATLAGDSGTYDLVETYSVVIPPFAAEDKFVALDDLWAKYKDKYKLGEISQTMLDGMSYDGKLYAVPTQANIHTMAYRKDVFDELGLKAPTNFDELIAAAKAIQDAGKIKYPIAMPYLASGDMGTMYMLALRSLGSDYIDESGASTLGTEVSGKAIEALKSLTPYMDPQVTTFDQPKVQQQMFNGTAAIAVMYSGRMADLINPTNSQFADKFAFAASPSIEAGGKPFASVSVDGWSIPKNSKVDPDLLFQVAAASISAEAGKAALPAAFPSREGIANAETVPYAPGIEQVLKSGAATPLPYPWVTNIQTDSREVVAQAVTGAITVEEALTQLEAAAVKDGVSGK